MKKPMTAMPMLFFKNDSDGKGRYIVLISSISYSFYNSEWMERESMQGDCWIASPDITFEEHIFENENLQEAQKEAIEFIRLWWQNNSSKDIFYNNPAFVMS